MRSVTKIVAVLLGLVALADSRAATFTLDRDVVPAGGSMVFSFTTELAGWPDTHLGTEWPSRVYFNGPSCSNGADIPGFAGQYGRDLDLPLPNLPPPDGIPWWGPNFNYPYGCQDLKPGSYLARFDYYRFDNPAQLIATGHYIELPFTVLKLELRALPYDIRVGETVLIEASGITPGESATSLQVQCPDGTVDQAPDVTPIDDGFSIIWPGPYFAGSCDSSQRGRYTVTLSTDQQSATAGFRAVGDRDGDGWSDLDDNCPNDPNPGQEDVDHDGRGDACDTDNDGDGVQDEEDNCPDVANTSQDDLEADGLGDACDPDIEDDGVLNAADNCPNHYNPGQENADGDAFGDPCDPDVDDSDNDGMNDLVDNCWNVFNPAQQDDDHDGIGTACDPDIDGDGVSNADEAAAGTNPNDPQLIEPGVNGFFDGEAIGSGASTPDGEAIGVVIDPPPDTRKVDVAVLDPWGATYSQQTLVPHSPVAFYFVPVWPGTWTIEADPDEGDVVTASFHVIPEPDALAAAAVAVLALGLAARRANERGKA